MAGRALRSFSEGGLRATESAAFVLEMPRAGARGASLGRHWLGRFPVEREVDLLVERVVTAFVDVVHDAERREDNRAAEHIGYHPPGPGSLNRIGGGVVAVFGEGGAMVRLAAEVDGARCEHVHEVVDDDVGLCRSGKERDGLMVSVHPGAATGQGPGTSNDGRTKPMSSPCHTNLLLAGAGRIVQRGLMVNSCRHSSILPAVLLAISVILQPENAATPLQRRSRFAQGLNVRQGE